MIINLDLGKDSYDIVLEKGVINRAKEELDLKRKVLIVTDSGVPKDYAECIASQCESPVIVTVPMGEGSKSIECFEKLLNAMLDNSFDRDSAAVAVGGGVVGDLSGFAASAFMRGIDFYNVPTTLLSQVDSSIGGKTAINLSGVKNIVGSFYQPKKVLIDPDVLDTLPERELSEGLAEAIKMAVTSDARLFSLIKNSGDLKADLFDIIKASLIIKRDVVEEDPFEHGKRKILNFGHTIGHGIEAFYKGHFLHGECVAMGMLYMTEEPFKSELAEVLSKYGLPVSCDAGADELMQYIKHDKKSSADGITVVKSSAPGSFVLEKAGMDEIEAIIKAR